MAAPARMYSLATLVDVTIVTTAETVIAGPLFVMTNSQSLRVDLSVFAAFAAIGATTTSIVFRFRRGTTVAGTLIGEAITDTTLVAAGVAARSFYVQDTPGEVVAFPYVVTAVCTAATANSTVGNSVLSALCHN